MIVAVLVATAVYDQGVVGVYTGEDAEQKAKDAAAEIWPNTDGHHGFRVDVMETDTTYEEAFPYFFLTKRTPRGPVQIEVESRYQPSASDSSTL